MMKWELNKKRIAIIGIVILLIGLFTIRIKVLTLEDYETGLVLKSFKLKDDTFTVLFTHSVMLSEVYEEYRVENGEIYLNKTKYKDYGAGLPTDQDYTFYIDEDEKMLIIDGIHRKMEDLVYRAGSKRANHRILIGGKEYELLDYTEEKRGILFKVEKINAVNLFMREVYK